MMRYLFILLLLLPASLYAQKEAELSLQLLGAHNPGDGTFSSWVSPQLGVDFGNKVNHKAVYTTMGLYGGITALIDNNEKPPVTWLLQTAILPALHFDKPLSSHLDLRTALHAGFVLYKESSTFAFGDKENDALTILAFYPIGHTAFTAGLRFNQRYTVGVKVSNLMNVIEMHDSITIWLYGIDLRVLLTHQKRSTQK